MPRTENSRLDNKFKEYTLFRDETCTSIYVTKIFNGAIIAFGIRQKEVLTKEGTFKEFVEYGYFDTLAKRYYCNKKLINDFRERFSYDVVGKELVVGTRATGSQVSAYNFDYKVAYKHINPVTAHTLKVRAKAEKKKKEKEDNDNNKQGS